MDRAACTGVALQPDLFHGEDQDRREPCGQPLIEQAQHCTGGATLYRVAVAIKRVLADVEIIGRQVERGEGKDRLPDPLEIKGRIACTHGLIQLREAVQHPLLQLRHRLRCGFISRSVIGQRAKHKAHRVAQTAIAIGHTFEDLRPNPLICGIVCLRHPQAQNIGTVLADDLIGHDGVADGFGHLQALFIQGHAVCNDIAVRGPARCAH